jgi:hypothetical protein
VSKRSERRRGPQRSGDEGAAQGGRPGEKGEARERGAGSRGRPGEARDANGGRPGDARPASRRAAEGRSVPARRATSGWGLGVQLAFLAAVFAVAVLVAELAGAANLGVALGVGQIAFAIAVIYLLVWR